MVRFFSIFGRGDRAGQQHDVGTHGGDRDLRLRHRQRKQLVDAADIRSDADVGRPDDVARGIAGVDRGFAARLAKHVKLALRLDLDVGDVVIGDENVGHRAGYVDQFAAADRKYDFRARANDRLGGCNRGRSGECQRRKRQTCQQHVRGKSTFHGIAP